LALYFQHVERRANGILTFATIIHVTEGSGLKILVLQNMELNPGSTASISDESAINVDDEPSECRSDYGPVTCGICYDLTRSADGRFAYLGNLRR